MGSRTLPGGRIATAYWDDPNGYLSRNERHSPQLAIRVGRRIPTQRLCARLYLEELATGDFEPVLRELVGETTALSANAVVRLSWGAEYEAWRRRRLGEHRYSLRRAGAHGRRRMLIHRKDVRS